MGRIKTTLIKRLTLKLYNEYKDQFKEDYEHNKRLVQELIDVESKKIRNVIAGYLTRLIKEKKEI